MEKLHCCLDCEHYEPYKTVADRYGEPMEQAPYCSMTNCGNLWCFPFIKTKCKLFKPNNKQQVVYTQKDELKDCEGQ